MKKFFAIVIVFCFLLTGVLVLNGCLGTEQVPHPDPTQSVVPTATVPISNSPTPENTPTTSSSSNPTPTLMPSTTVTPTLAPTKTPTPTVTMATATKTPTPTIATATPTKTPTPTVATPTSTKTPTPTPIPTPVAPSGLSASSSSTSSIHLTWSDNSTNETGFKIERSTFSTTGFTQIDTVGANVTSYDSNGLSANTTYYFRVRAYNLAGDSSYSGVASATTQQALAVLRIINNTKYYMVDIKLNGQEQVYYPSAISAGGQYDFTFTTPGTVNYYVGVGFYDSYGYPDVWFDGSGTTTVTAGQTTTVTFNNPTLGQLLSGFSSSATWEGDYWNADLTMGIATFKFFSSGSWSFYDNNVFKASGSLILVSWPDYATCVTFKLSSTSDVISLYYPFGQFYYNNGPASWRTIQYTKQ